MTDFLWKIDNNLLSADAIANLIKAGAFDRLAPNRNELLKINKDGLSKIKVIDPSQFYPVYHEQISVLNTSISELIREYTNFLDFLIETLEQRKSDLLQLCLKYLMSYQIALNRLRNSIVKFMKLTKNTAKI